MKKRLLSILLVLAIAFGATMPAFAANTENPLYTQADIEEKIEFFLGLLNDEARAELDAFGEGLAEAIVEYVILYLDDAAYWLGLQEEFEPTVLPTVEEYLEVFAQYLNEDPREVHNIVWILEMMGLWQPPTPFSEFTFGAEITRDDVAAVFYAVAEYGRNEGFDLFPFMEAADITSDDLIDLFFAITQLPGEIEWLINWYGDMWLVAVIINFSEEMMIEALFNGDDAVILILRAYAMFAGMMQYSDIDRIDIILDYVFDLTRYFHEDDLVNAMLNNPQINYTAAQLAAHSTTELEDMMSFHWDSAVDAFLENDNPPQGLLYINDLLGGFLDENREFLAETLAAMRVDLEAQQARREDMFRMEEYSAYLQRMNALALPTEVSTITADQLEQRFTRRITSEINHNFDLSSISEHRINLYFANRGDTPVTITYYFVTVWNTVILKRVVELPAGGRFSTQINFAEPANRAMLMSQATELLIFFTSEDDTPVDVHFAYRLTDFPQGHYTHGSH